MDKLDLKFYWSVFLRRLPYFLVVLALLSAIGITVAMILPPVYRSAASMLVEPQQIPGDLAQSTVPVNPFEQVQIIEQRLMTRANLVALADRIGLYADQPELSAGARVTDMRERIEFLGFEPDVTRGPAVPGATIIGVAFNAPTPEYANKGANELVNLVLEENVKLRTSRADDTLQFFESRGRPAPGRAQAQVRGDHRLQDGELRGAARQPRRPAQPPDPRAGAAPRARARGIGAEEPARHRGLGLRAHRPLRGDRRHEPRGGAARGAEERAPAAERDLCAREPAHPHAHEPDRRAREAGRPSSRPRARCPTPTASRRRRPRASTSSSRPIDARLEFIAQDKAAIEKTLAELEASIQATPKNEMVLAGLDRELANLNDQYNAAVASLGQAKVGERIEVLSKGERFSLIEQPTIPGSPVRPSGS